MRDAVPVLTPFAALHRPGRPLVLPNAWDFASAALLAAEGFRAVGTTSLGVAAAAGRPDATGATRAETVALARTIARVPAVLVTVDIEGGFADDPGGVADLVAELADAGVVGVNIEDGRADGTLAPQEHLAAVVAATKARNPGVFVNARTDTVWLGVGDIDESLRRGAAYLDAGADGVFVPGALDDGAVRMLSGELAGPLNVLALPGRQTVAEFAALGVARVSTGSLLFRGALGAAVRLAAAVRDGEVIDAAGLPSYADVQALAEPG